MKYLSYKCIYNIIILYKYIKCIVICHLIFLLLDICPESYFIAIILFTGSSDVEL